MMEHEKYMQRCLDLALLGAGTVAPNPMVGAVLVHEDRIIGEGYHQQYGQPHAEVNCIDSVQAADKDLISMSTIYVSLEPCAHYGKTPPCADLIIHNRIKKVVIGCRDPFKAVDGKGIEKLEAAGTDIVFPMMEEDCQWLNRRFFSFHLRRRPYIILKWAQTANGMMGGNDSRRLLISNELSQRLVHKWRSEEAAILVGTQTAIADNPRLDNRFWNGGQPLRLLLDRHLRVPATHHVLDGTLSTIVFNLKKQATEGRILYRMIGEGNVLEEICGALHELNVQSVLVEGGRQLLQAFIAQGLFDELRVITNNDLYVNDGLPAPALPPAEKISELQLVSDTVTIYKAVPQKA